LGISFHWVIPHDRLAEFLAGNALIIWYGPEEVHFTLEQLQLQWVAKPMLIFIAALLIVLAALHAATVYVRILERNQTARLFSA
jgi:hypothetical protein